MPEDPNIPPNSADALSQVTDDASAPHEARRWAQEQLLEGITLEELVEQLVAQQWELSEAEQIVESARKETRAQRGVLTRDDVLRELNMDYRRSTGGLSVAFRSGLFGLYGFTTGFMTALRSLRKLKGWVAGKDQRDDSSPPREG